MDSNSLPADLVAEETHTGRIWTLAILPTLIIPALSVALFPTTPARWALLLVSVIGLGVFVMMWSGFRYRFLRNGVEIRTCGFHLRSIPRQTILGYSIESWGLPRGYGIRGIGSSRAYVWGRKVVHIRTTNGEVFLGHSNPERIVRDLDLVTGAVSRS